MRKAAEIRKEDVASYENEIAAADTQFPERGEVYDAVVMAIRKRYRMAGVATAVRYPLASFPHWARKKLCSVDAGEVVSLTGTIRARRDPEHPATWVELWCTRDYPVTPDSLR